MSQQRKKSNLDFQSTQNFKRVEAPSTAYRTDLIFSLTLLANKKMISKSFKALLVGNLADYLRVESLLVTRRMERRERTQSDQLVENMLKGDSPSDILMGELNKLKPDAGDDPDKLLQRLKMALLRRRNQGGMPTASGDLIDAAAKLSDADDLTKEFFDSLEAEQNENVGRKVVRRNAVLEGDELLANLTKYGANDLLAKRYRQRLDELMDIMEKHQVVLKEKQATPGEEQEKMRAEQNEDDDLTKNLASLANDENGRAFVRRNAVGRAEES